MFQTQSQLEGPRKKLSGCSSYSGSFNPLLKLATCSEQNFEVYKLQGEGKKKKLIHSCVIVIEPFYSQRFNSPNFALGEKNATHGKMAIKLPV